MPIGVTDHVFIAKSVLRSVFQNICDPSSATRTSGLMRKFEISMQLHTNYVSWYSEHKSQITEFLAASKMYDLLDMDAAENYFRVIEEIEAELDQNTLKVCNKLGIPVPTHPMGLSTDAPTTFWECLLEDE